MEITSLDRSDDALLEKLYEIGRRSEHVDRVQPVHRTLHEIVTMWRHDWPGERADGAVAWVDGEPVGFAWHHVGLRDNLEKAWFDLVVDPPRRGQGIGTALLGWLEETARADGRTVLLGDVFVPVGDREGTANGGFARARGFEVYSTEIVRYCPLPVDEDVLGPLEADAIAGMGERYQVEVYEGGVPEHLRQGVCDCSNHVITDAPTGDVEFEAESMTPEDYVDNLAQFAKAGLTLLTAVAVEKETGEVAAYTDISRPEGDPSIAFQWGTLVKPEHRGHRLGMAVKIANLRRLLSDAPERKGIRTMNDEQNPWMIRINEDLGFRIIEEALAVKKNL